MKRARALFLIISYWYCVARLVTAQPFDTKIVNGSLAVPGEFPFIVSLRHSSSGRHFCGGSLLNSQWVLTAAHCVVKKTAKHVNIQYASNGLDRNSKYVVEVTKLYVHEAYIGKNNSFRDDIALVKLSKVIKMGRNVAAVKLPGHNFAVPNGSPSVLIGWGYNATGGSAQINLQKVNLQTYDFIHCGIKHGKPIPTTALCAGVPEGWKGQCSGDSGGPLLVNGLQVGIVSWSVKPCARPPYPGVFTRVSAYSDWMEKIMVNDDGVERRR